MKRRDLLRSGVGAVGAGLLSRSAAAASNATTGSTTGQLFGGRAAPGRRFDAWVGVNVANLTANLALVRERAGGRPVMGVVKADAYGHGLIPVAQALADAGIDAFMVANTQEAVALRAAEITTPIMHFGRVFGPAAELVIEHELEQMIDSTDAVSDLVAGAAMQRAEAVVHVHVDTGMGRVGVPWREAGQLIGYIGGRSRVRIAGVSTTFTEDPDFDRVQLRRLNEICDQAVAAGIDIGRRHAASSAAVLAMPDAHLDMVRPGMLLYGHYPSRAARDREPGLGLKPVLGLRARVVSVKPLRQGESVGYHRVYVAETAQTIALLPIGYSDGYPPEAVVGGGHVWIRGTRCPFVGEMTSNHCAVRIPEGLDVQPGELAVMIATGDEAAAFGADPGPAGRDPSMGMPTAEMVADWAGISDYQVHIQLSPELPRNLEGGRRRRF